VPVRLDPLTHHETGAQRAFSRTVCGNPSGVAIDDPPVSVPDCPTHIRALRDQSRRIWAGGVPLKLKGEVLTKLPNGRFGVLTRSRLPNREMFIWAARR